MIKAKSFAAIMAVTIVLLDQSIKLWALNFLKAKVYIQIIPGLFNLTYIENRGAAFGIFQGNTRFLSIVTGLIMLTMLFYVFSNKIKEPFLVYTIMLVVAGGLGNLIDRVFRSYVVDYLDFSALFGFPVFNLADCCVVIGTILLVIHIFLQESAEQSLLKKDIGGCGSGDK